MGSYCSLIFVYFKPFQVRNDTSASARAAHAVFGESVPRSLIGDEFCICKQKSSVCSVSV